MKNETNTTNDAVRPEDDPRLTAYAFDELEQDERAQVEALLERDPAARAHVDELKQLGQVLERDLAALPSPTALTPAQRQAIEAAAGGVVASAPRGRLLTSPWFKGLSALAAAVLGVGLIGVYASQLFDSAEDVETGARVAANAPVVSSRRAQDEGLDGRARDRGDDARPSDEALESLRALGYSGGEPSSETTLSVTDLNGYGPPPEAGKNRPIAGVLPPEEARTAPPEFEANGVGASGLEGSIVLPRGDASTREEAAAVWKLQLATAEDPASQPLRGAGDTVTPGAPVTGGGAPAAGQPAGAAGPGAPATAGRRVLQPNGTATGADGFFLGRGERELESRARLSSSARERDYYRDLDEVRRPDVIRAQAGNEGYDALPENEFMASLVDSRSTFSIDVDTASYANVRRFLRQAKLPPRAAVRIEEMVNAFSYDYAGPTDEHPFAVHTEIVNAPWKAGHKLLRVGLQGTLPTNEEPVGRNLVFLVDVSGSMSGADKLPLVQRSLEMLVDALRPQDTIGIVTYAGNSGIALQPTAVAEKELVLAAIQSLRSGGSTNGAAGIVDAYRLARQHFVKGGVNRVVLATDGDFNVGVSDRAGLEQLITQKRESGVFLSVLGFGQGNLKDSQMEALADKGNGNYAYIDSIREARKVLVRNLDGTLETIAKDVKLQLEFNPLRVQAFRLIGYENRVLAHRDFNDDRKDAGEIGAGHSVTALYELVPVGADLAGTPPLKYQQVEAIREPSEAAHSGEALTIQLRYKRPDGDVSTLLAVPVLDAETSFDEASQDTRFAAAVASFGMLLRGSQHAGATSFEAVHSWAAGALGADADGDRREFLTLVDWAIQASLGGSRSR